MWGPASRSRFLNLFFVGAESGPFERCVHYRLMSAIGFLPVGAGWGRTWVKSLSSCSIGVESQREK